MIYTKLYEILATSDWYWCCSQPRRLGTFCPGFPSASRVCTLSRGVVLASLVRAYMLFMLSTGGKWDVERFYWGYRVLVQRYPSVPKEELPLLGWEQSPVMRKGEFKVWKMQIKALRIIRRMACLSGDREGGKSG